MMMRVLLTTFPEAFLHQGGGEREMFLLKDALEMCGMVVDIYGPTSGDVSGYNAAIHFSVVEGSEGIIKALKEAGVKLILWPNLWFTSTPQPENIKGIKNILDYFEVVVFRTVTECNHCQEYFDLSEKNIIQSASIVSQKFLNQDVSNVFSESYGIDRYAIWPGIIEPIKNQISAIRAFKDLNLQLVISGRVRDRAYMDMCKREAGSNVHFIPAMPFGSELHVSALKYCSVFIELPLDFPGASAVEAATVGCNMLLSKSEWTREVMGNDCSMVDPMDLTAISDAIVMLEKSSSKKKKFDHHIDGAAAVRDLVRYLKGSELR
jgi:hypothetical protein